MYDATKAAASRYKRVETARKLVWDFLSANPCPCGESDPAVLELHHPDPSTKTGNISDFMQAGNLKRLHAELQQVLSLCANCHRRESLAAGGAYKHRWSLMDTPLEAELHDHATLPQALYEDNLALAAHDMGW